MVKKILNYNLDEIELIKALTKYKVTNKECCRINSLLTHFAKMRDRNFANALDSFVNNAYIVIDKNFVLLTEKGQEVIYMTEVNNNDQISFTLEQKKAARFKMLNFIFEDSNGDQSKVYRVWETGDELGFPRKLTKLTFNYLKEEGLIKAIAMGAMVITHYGITQIEDALNHPDNDTEYFLPVNVVGNINIINADNGSTVQIQQGTTSSTQELSTNDMDSIKKWIRELNKNLTSIELNDGQIEEINNERETIEAILETKKPKRSIITGSLKIIKDILISATSSAIVQGLLSAIPLI